MNNTLSCRTRGRLAWVALALVLSATPAGAADVDKAAGSLKLVPADAAFYTASLRMGEQLEAIAKSKAWAKLADMEAVQMAWKQAQGELNKPGNPLGQFLQARENRELLDMLGDMFAREAFCYGGTELADLMGLMLEVQRATQFAPAMAALSGMDPNVAQARAALQAIQAGRERLKVPGLVFGFHLDNTKRAGAQLERLEKLLGNLVEQAAPLKGRFKKVKIGGGDFLTLALDGSMVPWQQVPFDKIESMPGEFDDLVKKLQTVKLTVTLGVRENYLVFALGESTAPVAALGGARTLADRDELKPLARHADKRVASIGYTSKVFTERMAAGGDLEKMADNLQGMLAKLDLTEAERARIRKDLAALGKDLKSATPEVGASLSFTFLTERGAESYGYDWTRWPGGPAKAKPLTLLEHLGGTPLVAAVGRSAGSGEGYAFLSKWAKVLDGYVDDIVLPKVPQPQRDQVEAVLKAVRPQLRRLDNVTAKMLIPALADGQVGFVLDAKLTARRWHQLMPEAKQPLPMLEPALVFGVSDAALLEKALGEYRQIANTLIANVAAVAGQAVPFEIPPAETRKVKGGTLYYYGIPEVAGVDERILPNAGIGPKVAVFSLAAQTSERLLASTPLKAGGLLARTDRAMHGASYVNFEGVLKAAAPWVEYALEQGLGDMPKEQQESILKQARTALEVMSVMRSFTSYTVTEDRATMTHSETVIRDLGEKP